MANRNAARHLLLVVSVLLCFFVYMGYRLRGSGEPAEQPGAIRSTDVAALTAPDASRSGGQARLMTMDDAASGGRDASRPPIATPSARPPSMSAGENIPDAAAPARPARNGDMPPASPPAGRPAPSGSIEESAARPPAGEITGLVPAPPVNSSVASVPAAANARGESAPPSAGPAALSGGGQAGSAPQAAPPAPIPAAATASGRVAEATPARPAATTASGMVPPPPAASAPTARTEEARPAPASPAPRERAAPPAPPAVPALRREAEASQSESLRIYVVRPGDTLSRIAARELGSISLADNIFLLNRDVIADPNHLFAGMRIRLPVRDAGRSDALSPRAGETGWAPPARNVGASERARVHTVARGETLSSISLRYYGSSSGWRTIHEANRNVIENPNRLAVGTELVIPPLGEAR